ncbi:MAG: hypothetical protein INF84_15995 [Roseomonas sp.]|nr:hypothetical protein [Roseomonas sp.]
MRRAAWIIGFIAVQAACIWVVQPDLGRLWAGLPRLAGWIAGGFPPDFSGFGDLAARSAETLALATLGTTLAGVLALLAARPANPYAHANRQVTAAHRAWMAGLPYRLIIRLPDGRRLAVLHGGASDISRFIFASAEHKDLADEIAATGCDGVIAGHCGIPFVRQVGPGVWINAGAIGMPADDGTPRIWFALLTPGKAGLSVEILPLQYDHAAAAAAMRAAGLPEGYAAALGSGLWPSCDVLPPAERARRGQKLLPAELVW